jgi:hypothetical protein
MNRPIDSLAADALATPRRIALRVIAATGLGLVAVGGKGPNHAMAKKNKKNKKCGKHKPAGPATCPDLCPEGIATYHLVGGGDVCSASANLGFCINCETDSDCSEVNLSAVCLASRTEYGSDEKKDFTTHCNPYPSGICAVLKPCVL